MKSYRIVVLVTAIIFFIIGCKKEKECDKNDPNSSCYVPPVINNPTDTIPTGPVDPYAEAKEECAKKSHPDSTYTWNDALKLCEATYIGKPPVDCTADSIAHVDACNTARKDSIAIVNHQDSAPSAFTTVVEYAMSQGMNREEAWEAALRSVRDYPEYYPELVKNYVNTYLELVDAFEKSKTHRENTYNAWVACTKLRDE